MTNEKRSSVLQLYVTPEEKRKIEAHARLKGIPTAVYLRMLALNDVGDAERAEDKSAKPKK